MIKTQGDRNLIANVLGVIGAFVAFRLSFLLDDTGLLAIPLACLAMPIIPVLYACTVAWRGKQTLPRYLQGPEASRVTHMMLIACGFVLFFLVYILINSGADTVSKAIRKNLTLPDSFEFLALSCLTGIVCILLSLWPKDKALNSSFQPIVVDSAKTPPQKDNLDMRILGILIIVFAVTLFMGHVVIEKVLEHPVITFTQKRGWGGIVILFVPLVMFNILNALSDAIARHIRQRQATDQLQSTLETRS